MCVLREFKNIKKSNLGNLTEYEDTLSHEDDYWGKYYINGIGFIKNRHVLTDAIVYNDISFSDICVCDHRQIDCMLPVFSIVHVYSNAQIYGHIGGGSGLYVYKKIKTYCRSKESSNVHVNSCVLVYNYVEVLKKSNIYVNALVCNYTTVCKKAKVYGYLEVSNCEDFRNEKALCIGGYILCDIKKLRKNDTMEEFSECITLFMLFEIMCGFAFCINKHHARCWQEGMDLSSFMGVGSAIC
ncbi:hypothetical protein [Bartonella pachyuromydis]|uniref:Phage related protein n=1 Tax=Bartonella pachyuromydis TaxID=931097 RepID=A0ABP8VFY5_9HYPH